MSIETANHLIAELGQRMGLPEMQFDNEGYCTIGLDDHILNFERYDHGRIISLYVWLGVVPEARRAAVALDFADANFLHRQTYGATLGLDRNSGDAALALQIYIPELSLAQFEQIVENAVNLAEVWKNRLGEPAAAAPDEPAALAGRETRWRA